MNSVVPTASRLSYGQEDIVTMYTDIGGPVNTAAGSFRLGVETYERVKLFSVTSQKDIMYVEWRFKNVTEYVNEDVNGDGSDRCYRTLSD